MQYNHLEMVLDNHQSLFKALLTFTEMLKEELENYQQGLLVLAKIPGKGDRLS